MLPLSAQPHDKDLGTKYTFSGYVGVQTAANGPAGWTAGSTNHSSEMAKAVGAHSRSKEEADAPVAVHRPFRMYCACPFKLDHTVHYMQYSGELYSTVCAYSTELYSLWSTCLWSKRLAALSRCSAAHARPRARDDHPLKDRPAHHPLPPPSPPSLSPHPHGRPPPRGDRRACRRRHRPR